MSSASVRSFDAIQRVREELLKFSHRSGEGLTELEAEIRRVLDWIEHDRPGYWKERVRRARDAENEAKNDLHRCLMYPINDEQPSCAEERMALKKAQQHVRYCEEKQKKLREWAGTLRHELHEFRGRTAKLKQAIEIDSQRSTALLSRSLEALERYATGMPGTSGSASGPTSSAPSESSDSSEEGTQP